MKTSITLSLILFTMAVGNAPAQSHQLGSKEKMHVFASWAGHWQGEGWMQMGPGQRHSSRVDEYITYKLDSTLILVEGIGKVTDSTQQERIVHEALALLNYDQFTQQYKFRTFLRDGRGTDAWLKIIGANKFQWGFEIPTGGQTRYTLTIDPQQGTWKEIGEFSRDGNTWMNFFEMNLKKVK